MRFLVGDELRAAIKDITENDQEGIHIVSYVSMEMDAKAGTKFVCDVDNYSSCNPYGIKYFIGQRCLVKKSTLKGIHTKIYTSASRAIVGSKNFSNTNMLDGAIEILRDENNVYSEVREFAENYFNSIAINIDSLSLDSLCKKFDERLTPNFNSNSTKKVTLKTLKRLFDENDNIWLTFPEPDHAGDVSDQDENGDTRESFESNLPDDVEGTEEWNIKSQEDLNKLLDVLNEKILIEIYIFKNTGNDTMINRIHKSLGVGYYKVFCGKIFTHPEEGTYSVIYQKSYKPTELGLKPSIFNHLKLKLLSNIGKGVSVNKKLVKFIKNWESTPLGNDRYMDSETIRKLLTLLK